MKILLYEKVTVAVFVTTVLAGLFLIMFSSKAHAYTDEQVVNAIYKAEGGKNAQYPYGIRSVNCETKEKCREICLRTVRNNSKRYLQYGFRRYSNFIAFLANRYCPTRGSNLSKAEMRLNGNWVKNVTYFLRKENV